MTNGKHIQQGSKKQKRENNKIEEDKKKKHYKRTREQDKQPTQRITYDPPNRNSIPRYLTPLKQKPNQTKFHKPEHKGYQLKRIYPQRYGESFSSKSSNIKSQGGNTK